MKPPIYIGIDPGATGGIGMVDHDFTMAFSKKLNVDNKANTPNEYMDNITELADLVRFCKERSGNHLRIVIGIERVNPRPGQAVMGVFNYGRIVGAIFGALTPLIGLDNIKFYSIEARAWQHEYKLDTGKKYTEKKKENREKAIEMFDRFDTVKITHAVADAMLIAEYMRRNYNQESLEI